MRRQAFWVLVCVTGELFKHGQALAKFLDDAKFLAPEGAVNPEIRKYFVCERDQEPDASGTMIRVYGVAERH